MKDCTFTAVYHKQLGDTVLLEPALYKASLCSGNTAQLICPVAFNDVVSLFRNAKATTTADGTPANNLIAYDPSSKSSWASLKTKAKHKTLLLMGARYQKWYHRWLFNSIESFPLENRYRAQYYWEHTPGASDHTFSNPQLNPPPPEWNKRHDIPDEYLLIHPTSAWQQKCWPAERWIKALNEVYQQKQIPLVFTSGPDSWEQMHVQEITSGLKCPYTNLAGRTSLREFISIISKASYVTCIDCSAFHLASALQRQVLGLFGHASSEHWASTAPHVHVLSSRIHSETPSKRMTDLQLDTVSNKLLTFVSNT